MQKESSWREVNKVLSQERLNQRVDVHRRLVQTIKMKQTFDIPELDQLIEELENELRRKEHEA